MNADHERIWQGVEARFSSVEAMIPPAPPWRPAADPTVADGRFAVIPRFDGRTRASSSRLDLLLAGAVVVLAAAVLLPMLAADGDVGAEATPPPAAPPSADPTPSFAARSDAAVVASFEPRLALTGLPPGWLVASNAPDALAVAYLFEEAEREGNNVSVIAFPLTHVFEPPDELNSRRAPEDFVGWLTSHPDLDAQDPTTATVDGLQADQVDATVTYQAGSGRGATAAFIGLLGGPLNLVPGTRSRFVIVDLPDRRLVVMLSARTDLFAAAVGPFEELLGAIDLDRAGSSP